MGRSASHLWCLRSFVAEKKSSHSIDQIATSGLSFPHSPNAKASRGHLFHSQRIPHLRGCMANPCLGFHTLQVDRGKEGQTQERGRPELPWQ